MKHKAKALTLALLLVGGGIVIFFACADAIPRERFDKVAVGMTQVQVKQILGVPRIRHDTADSTTFFYGGFRKLKWCTMEVFFGADGYVKDKFHDH